MKGTGWTRGAAGLAAAVMLLLPAGTAAYGRGEHKDMFAQAVNVFGFPMIREEARYMAVWDGAGHEDEYDHIWEHGGNYVTCTHFWEPDDEDISTTYYYAGEGWCGNAWMKAKELLKRSFMYWNNAKTAEPYPELVDVWRWNIYYAFEHLGHVTHLIGDMTVPAHAHVDYHTTFDSYDDGWIGLKDDGEVLNYWPWIRAEVALAEGGAVVAPEGIVQHLVDHADAYNLNHPHRAFATLFYLMYTAAQTGDYFASDDYDGDTEDRFGWMDYTGWPSKPVLGDQLDDNYWLVYNWDGTWTWVLDNGDGDYSRIASKSLPYVTRAVAALIRAWRDAIDAVPPVTTATVEYQYPPQGGWTRGWVWITLAATDDNTGFHRSYWAEGPASTLGGATHEYDIGIPVTAEGRQVIRYWSEDRFGNLEAPHWLELGIDGTPPEITGTSPRAGDFHLTSDELLIDWSASDATSGVGEERAWLDGTPVAKGQVVDLASMAGDHLFVLEVSDAAGNTSRVEAAFGVAVAGTAVLEPGRLNARAVAGPLTAYVELAPGYDAADIDPGTVTLAYQAWAISAGPSPTEVGDQDGDLVPDRMIRLPRQDVLLALASGADPAEEIETFEVVVQGQLSDGTWFWAPGAVEVRFFW